jgi:hypothetical protein
VANFERYLDGRPPGARSGEVVADREHAFYRQIEQPLDHASTTKSESMVSSILESEAAQKIEAFLQTRPARRAQQ